MTLLESAPPSPHEDALLAVDDLASPTDVTSADEAVPEAGPGMVALASFFAVAAAGWMCAGIFRGGLPRAAAVLGAALGTGIVALSYRTRRPVLVQYLSVPAAVVAGALLSATAAGGGTANLIGLVQEALRSGGISNPPVPFDPGWRFLLLVLTSLLGTCAAALGAALSRPKLGIFIAGPVLFAAGLVQPASATFASSAVALVLFVAALGVSYGADLARDGARSGEFELRRVGRAAAVLGVLVVGLLVLSQAGFLFPDSKSDQVIPPRRPPTPPAQPDRVLFTFRAPAPLPIHLGVLDVYRDNAWMTPPFDAKRLQKVGPAGELAGGIRPGEVPALPALADDTKLAVSFTIEDVQGHVLPSVANPQRITRKGVGVEFDPRTQDLRLPDRRVSKGMTYTVEGPRPPSGKDLAAVGPASPQVAEYLSVPQAPPEVQDLLLQAPSSNPFDRLQFLRSAYYQRVVAAGAGNPVDTPPPRVAQLLAGQEGSPYEIAAGEVLLARWAGVPARLAFGYYGGKSVTPGVWEVRPQHGGMWLEAYFEGHGWVPFIGTPPKAKASLRSDPKKENPAVRPSENLALVTLVPVELDRIQLLYVLVRYWALRAVPWVIAAALLLAFYPGLLKIARRHRRRRWAAGFGPPERIAVAYAELRDATYDLNIGRPTFTPLRFLSCVAPDAEHQELAWLVTRTLWGDLVRDVRAEDAEAAEDMARSVLRRIRRTNPRLNRIVGFGSRVSLRTPYTDEIPNLWATRTRRHRVRGAARWLRRRVGAIRLPVPRRPVTAAIVVFVLGLLIASCGGGTTPVAGPGLPERVVPPAAGEVTFHPEPQAEAAFAQAGPTALIQEGRMFSLHQGEVVQGSLEVAAFKQKYVGRPRKVRDGVLHGIGSGNFTLTRLGPERVFEMKLPDQRVLVWFAPNGRYFVLLVARQGFDTAAQVMVDLLAYQRGETPSADDAKVSPAIDHRRTVKA